VVTEYSEQDLDFTKFNLGQGTTEQKQKKIRAVVGNLLDDDLLLRNARNVLSRIKQNRKKKTWDVSSESIDFKAANLQIVKDFKRGSEQWKEYFYQTQKVKREKAKETAVANSQNKRVMRQVMQAKWAYVRQQKDKRIVEVQEHLLQK
jgi:hypothetical protein